MKNKPNISLVNLSELKSVGLRLALRKGFNEAVNRVRGKTGGKANAGAADGYADMLSVIICTANCGGSLKNAIHSIQQQDFPREKFELIVVNNSGEPLPPLPGFVRVVNEPQLGLSRARNVGARAAAGKLLLYIDDDAAACEGLLSAMYAAFCENAGIAIVGGQIFLEVPQPVPEVFLRGKESIWSGYTVPYKRFHRVREQYEFPYGACFAVRHGVLDALGGFSEEYGRCGDDFAGGEETALCFAALNAGMEIGIEPRAAVRHCVLRERFTEEHIRRTIRAGIFTTQKLFEDGYAPSGWSEAYINERINIINSEIKRLTERSCGLEVFYKRCELDAFCGLRDAMCTAKPQIR